MPDKCRLKFLNLLLPLQNREETYLRLAQQDDSHVDCLENKDPKAEVNDTHF